LILMLKSQPATAKPLRLFKPGKSLPILSGPLWGKMWILNSSERSCWLGTYQKEKQRLFSRFLCPGKVAFDIGGKVGFFTLLASRLVRKTGQVVVFEPQPRNLDYLYRHIQRNRARNVTVIEAAVSYKNDSITGAAARADEAGAFPAKGPSRSRTCTLDGLLERGQIPIPDLIHMDIGGGEFAALCGARSLLSQAHPAIILTTHGEIPHRESCAFLEMLDYRLEPLDGKTLEASREILATHI